MTDVRDPERYFYHSFPRPREGTDQAERGVAILRSLCQNGLLLVPEKVEWTDPTPNTEGLPIAAVQKRIAFTELSPVELAAHSDVFGPFALEYDIGTLQAMGALPVFVFVGFGVDLGAPQCGQAGALSLISFSHS